MTIQGNISNAIHTHTGAWQPMPRQADRIAQEIGTPAFVYNADYIRQNFGNLRDKIDSSIDILYSLKANPNAAIIDCLSSCGSGAEVSSQAELHTAVRVGVNPKDIIFVGPAKTREEISDCMRFGIFAIVAESMRELSMIDTMAKETSQRRPVNVMLRVNPDFATAGSGLTMSGKPRQFGIDIEQMDDVRDQIQSLSAVRVMGFHVYMGTRYLEPDPIIENTTKILAMGADLAEKLGVELEAVDVGGGFGIPYFEDEDELDVGAVAEGVNHAVARFRDTRPDCRVIIELGRYLSAGCGALLTSVRYTKTSRGEDFAVADGGTNLHMAAVGTGGFARRSFPVLNLSRSNDESEGQTTLTGPLCTPSDTLARKAHLGSVEVGDTIAILCSGAYGPSASPTGFLSHGHPAEVLMDGDELHLVRAAETVEDIIAPYRLPGDLPLQKTEDAFSITVRLSAADAHYGGSVVSGARILELFGDAVTGLAAINDGDESLLQQWDQVAFQRPVYPGDFVTVRARTVRKSRLRRHVQVTAQRTVRATDPATSTVAPVHPPETVAEAEGLIVVPMPNRRKTGKETVS